jgi:hypothetical protein
VNVHKLSDESGREFELHIDDSSRIAAVVGAWPEGREEFALQGPLPAHSDVESAPAHIQAEAAQRGMAVCFYDDAHCQTCYCDKEGNVMYCKGIC